MQRPPSLPAILALVALAAACKSGSTADAPPPPKASAPAAAKESAPTPAPTAQPYVPPADRMKVKVSFRTSDYLGAIRDLYTGTGSAAAVRPFFVPGPAGDAPAAAITKAALDDAKAGAAIVRYEIRVITVDAALTHASVDVFEMVSINGAARCSSYPVTWSIGADTMFRADSAPSKVVPCPSAPN